MLRKTFGVNVSQVKHTLQILVTFFRQNMILCAAVAGGSETGCRADFLWVPLIASARKVD